MSNFFLLIYVAATSLGLIFVKLGTADGVPIKISDGRLQLMLNPQVVGGIMLYAISFMLYVYLISRNDLGYIVPLTTAMVYITVFTGSFFIFHETFTVAKIISITLILIGIICLNIQR